MKMRYHSHLCGSSFSNASIYTIVVSPKGSMMISYLGSTLWGSGSWWWITYTKTVTLNGEMLIYQLRVKLSHCVQKHMLTNIQVIKVTHISNVMMQLIVGFHKRLNIMVICFVSFLLSFFYLKFQLLDVVRFHAIVQHIDDTREA